MGTAGDDYLRGMLSNSVSAPAMVSRAGDAPPPAGDGTWGGYLFDEDTLRAKIIEWEDLKVAITRDRMHLIDAREALDAPSKDQPAREQAKATEFSITAAIVHNEAMLGYVENYIHGLEKALVKYGTRERLVTDTLNSGSPQGGQ
jgi:hypothetical protein